MAAKRPDKDERRRKASAHVCPQCGLSINLKDIGLKGGTTGLITCPKCDLSGPIEIQIVDEDAVDHV